MSTFFDEPVGPFAAANRSRSIAAGIDPYQYDAVTAGLASLREWPDAFARTARDHLARAERARLPRSAGDAYRDAALWFHFATVLPNPDLAAHGRAAAASADALRRSLALLAPDAEHVTGPDFTGILHRASVDAPLVLLVPGMNSGKAEFMPIAEALVARGLSVLAIDGPGQGELAVRGTWEPDYQRVVRQALDIVGAPPAGVGVIGLSMGGFLAAVAAHHEPRVRAVVTVSGPTALAWDELPPYVTETFVLRTGGEAAAREFARRVTAPDVPQPLRVLDGGLDVIPGVANGAELARRSGGEYVLIPEGGHLLENTRWTWLPETLDWLATRLGQDAALVVTRYVEAVANGDLDTITASFADDATWTYPGDLPLTGTWKGRDAIVGDFLGGAGRLFQPGGEPKVVLTNVIADGDRVVAEWTSRGTARNGRAYDNLCLGVFTVRDGRITSVREYTDTQHVERTLFAPE
ncbi:alpha/beta fold hydrolase [Actinomadura bangladeshensis]|uniref:Alpha/beta fold hydrolase n=1 Tax=Actinomadura bangladeshensis TaxID=453573 RepID=A0A6L9QF56_9ACTN|nr:alpha/beta fold hydrolase [Actinomadura bangladeshensis]NEA24101.1 alpha/beta fold hydrolase [Actinomadura bangladeshensis]